MKRQRRDGFRFGSLVLGLLLLGGVSFFAWFFASAFFRPSSGTGGWTEVPCLIRSSEVERLGVDLFVFTAEYDYYWNGQMRHSSALDRPGSRQHTFDHLDERLPLLEQYAPGTAHVCRVEPGSDGNAVLPVKDPLGGGNLGRGGMATLAGVFGATFLLVALVAFWLMARAFPRARRFLDVRILNSGLALFMTLFGVPFAVIGIVTLAFAEPARGPSADELVAVPGKVLYSGIRTSLNQRSATYSARVGYEYVFQGKKYESDRVFGLGGEFSTSNRRGFQEVADSYPPGSDVEVWVLPDDPRRSSLRPTEGASAGYATLAVSALFLLFGLAASGTGVFLLIRALRPRHIGQTGQWNLRRSRLDLLFDAMGAVFWNLLSWALVFAFLSAPVPPVPADWLLCLFPLIGLVLAVSLAVAIWRDLRAPKLSMTLTLFEGAPPALDWHLGAPSSVRSLAIRLEGLASSNYKSKKAKYSVPVCKHAAPVPENGHATFNFPPASCHAEKWRFVATLRLSGVRRPHRLEYPIPGTFP